MILFFSVMSFGLAFWPMQLKTLVSELIIIV